MITINNLSELKRGDYIDITNLEGIKFERVRENRKQVLSTIGLKEECPVSMIYKKIKCNIVDLPKISTMDQKSYDISNGLMEVEGCFK